MDVTNEYLEWKIAYDLISRNDFDLIQADEKNNEIWLKGEINNQTTVVRLFNKGFDWANHLKRDIAFTVERIRKIQKMFKGKHIDILNIYIASYQPVDSWEYLKKQIILKDKKTITTKTFYIDEEQRGNKLQSLYETLTIQPDNEEQETDPEILERKVKEIKHQIVTQHQEKKNEINNLFNYGKPFFTYILIAINVIVYFLLESKGDSSNTLHLIDWGAKFNPYIMDGEWWRIITSMFLHIGTVHIMMNMIALYYLGVTVEKIFGNTRFILIYFLSGILGGLTSFAFNNSVAAGASGAIFGMFGALLFFGVLKRKVFVQTMGVNLLLVIGLNILLGFTVPNIDMGAHLGGLVGGFLAAAVVTLPKVKNITYQVGGLIIYAALLIGLISYGIFSNENNVSPEDNFLSGTIHNENNEYNLAIENFTKAIESADEKDERYYFERSYAYIQLQMFEKARDDLIEVISINDNLAGAHHNLAIVYFYLNEYDKAYEQSEKAVQLEPNDKQFNSFLDELSNFH